MPYTVKNYNYVNDAGRENVRHLLQQPIKYKAYVHELAFACCMVTELRLVAIAH